MKYPYIWNPSDCSILRPCTLERFRVGKRFDFFFVNLEESRGYEKRKGRGRQGELEDWYSHIFLGRSDQFQESRNGNWESGDLYIKYPRSGSSSWTLWSTHSPSLKTPVVGIPWEKEQYFGLLWSHLTKRSTMAGGQQRQLLCSGKLRPVLLI